MKDGVPYWCYYTKKQKKHPSQYHFEYLHYDMWLHIHIINQCRLNLTSVVARAQRNKHISYAEVGVIIYPWQTFCNDWTHLTLYWRHNGHDSVSNHQLHDCLLKRLFRRKSKRTSKLRVTGLCAGKSPETGEFPAQMASYAENVSTWWRHHD